MENASKALIIAGAILLAILIISLGILIYNQASSVVNDNAMSQVEITQFNTQFTQYQGTQRGSAVRALYQEVLSNNVSQDDDDRQVSINLSSATADIPKLEKSATQIPSLSGIKTGGSYEVGIEYGPTGQSNAGLVTNITIRKK